MQNLIAAYLASLRVNIRVPFLGIISNVVCCFWPSHYWYVFMPMWL